MPSRLTHIEHVFGGGWAPDYGSMAVVSLDEGGRVEIPWLMDAANCEFEADGTPHKIGGNGWLNAAILEGGEDVRGLHDFWDQGTSGSPDQKRYIHVGTKIKMDQADGNFSDIFTGILSSSVPNYSEFEGQLIIAQTGPNSPKVSDGSTHEDLPSGTPNFAFSEKHGLRQWAAGVEAAPSTLFYSAQEDPTDWTGDGSGDIAISPGDGDRITAIASHRNELFVFKGPHKGSIHRISGSAPLGDDAFARSDFVPSGLGAVGQRSIFRFGNDLGFMWTDGSVHSLNTTERYGDFLEKSLSRPLNGWLRDHVTPNALHWASAAVLDSLGVVRIAIPVDSNKTNNYVISMDFRFDPPRWAPLPGLANYCKCLALGFYPSSISKHVMMAGDTNGRVRVMDLRPRSFQLAGRYPTKITTPFLSYTQATRTSTIYYGGVRVTPKGAGNITFSWVRDGHTKQSTSFLQWTGDVLAVGPLPDETVAAGATAFTLGTSTLAGERAITHSLDLTEGGEFHQIQYEIYEDGGTFLDVHVKSILASIKPGAISTEAVA